MYLCEMTTLNVTIFIWRKYPMNVDFVLEENKSKLSRKLDPIHHALNALGIRNVIVRLTNM